MIIREPLPKLYHQMNSDQKSMFLKLFFNTITGVGSDMSEESAICPHCNSKKVNKNGKENLVQKFKCKHCNKEFRSSTKSALFHVKKKKDVLHYLQCMFEGKNLRKSAELVAISLPTSYQWRHKILNYLTDSNTRKLAKQARSILTGHKVSVQAG